MKSLTSGCSQKSNSNIIGIFWNFTHLTDTMSKSRVRAIWIILTGIIVASLILFFVEKEKRDLLAYVAVFGTIASIVGLILAYIQILSLRDTSDTIKKEVEKTIKRVDVIVSISDISKTKTLIEDIQTYLRSKNYYGAIIRMGDLKEALVSAKYTIGLENIQKTTNYKNCVMNTGIDISSINDYLIKRETEPDVTSIMKNLESTKQLLVNYNNIIKKQSYGGN